MNCKKLNHISHLSISLLLLSILMLSNCKEKKAAPFVIGADISFVPQNEARRGSTYKDINGNKKDVVEIMKEHHFNNIRLRLFVNPEAENGYSKKGFCGLEETIKMAKRAKDAGMNVTLDFHYSDTWADPDKQFKPMAWKGQTGKELENSLYNYTKMALNKFIKADAAPDIIQIGNEISHGMVWPEGKVLDNAKEEDWAALMGLYNAGEKACREVLPEAKLMIHLALGGQNNLCREFLDYMKKYDAEYDIIGLSYYERWHETYNDLKANLYDLSTRYNKPVCVAEYGASKENIKIINDIVRSVPNNLGYGTMAWEPTRVLFNREGKASKEIFSIYDDIHEQYSNPKSQPIVPPPFKRTIEIKKPVIGADISFVPQEESRGKKYSDKGVEKDVLEILKDNKFNYIRLRLFVDPDAEKGYSRGGQGFCGLEKTLEMAKRIKATGMKFLLDLHYSDTWADPGKQYKPASWEKINGSALEGQVYKYTNETIKKFIAEGVRPDMVQVGNEINNGMIWPQGKLPEGDEKLNPDEEWESFCVLLRCASAAVRAADPSIVVMVHIASGGQNKRSVAFFNKIISRDVKFDVIGQSYYPKHHGTLEDLEFNLNDLAKRYKKPIFVVEYSEKRKEVNDIVHNIPNGLGYGTFIWEATSTGWGGLFDRQGNTNEFMKIYPKIYSEYTK
ncbi:glycosyl hydrolase 53 family protein [Wenyingzhuangia sp. chi5]|uniref:Arabinogalactan endo-beta-1,4-galactanase n=1 Tax=Wenyingzhuangia gilva TaxID=3057677 RepID=A0ABT8VUB5_9FLAO|nr:glycosyl hydrolase 53 family protein [Wenyingzhuangia sp. chi5]MDO3695561.1 glycosyl hydrolase 53 family protein [Wenyingzhuangia sp. chi5]